MVLVTACRAASPREGIDFLPLTVDYREYTYASGRIPGGFFKREGKPAEKEVLTSRLIDRPIRPLLPGRLALRDADHRARCCRPTRRTTPTCSRITGASAALALSDIPVPEDDRRRARRPGRRPVRRSTRPSQQRKDSKLDLIVAGSKDGLVMVEAGAKEVTEEQVVGALEAAHAGDQADRRGDRRPRQGGRQEEARRRPRRKIDPALRSSEVEEKVLEPLTKAMRIHDKLENYETVDQVLADLLGIHRPRTKPSRRPTPSRSSSTSRKRSSTTRSSSNNVRLDGRKLDEVRPIWIETSVLPRTHGSAVFTRGETQALVTCTLGTADDAQKIETLRGRNVEELHAPLQLPAVLGR